MNKPGANMSKTVEKKVIEIISEQAVVEPAKLHLDTTLADMGIDSLGVVETVFAIEEAFDIEVPFNANNPEESEFDTATVRAMIEAVEHLIADQHG